MTEQSNDEVQEEVVLTAYTDFMETSPPSQLVSIGDLTENVYRRDYGENKDQMIMQDLQLHCPNENCNGVRFFRYTEGKNPIPSKDGHTYMYVSYKCSNCQKYLKTFSLAVKAKGDGSGELYKFGELPTFGPPVPSRMLSLVGPDRELFLKGRRCENQGLGVGAFVYYRRVIEAQKNRIFDEMIKVCRRIGAEEKFIAELEAAKQETQFSKAISSIKTAIPQVLLIDGHNPIQLLHTALSNGLHDQSDEHCMELATSVRIVLAELSERMSQAMKDTAELKSALGKIMSVKKPTI